MMQRVGLFCRPPLAVNQINEAKAILVRTRNVSDSEAYRAIREQAMSKRVPIEEIACAIVHANGVLSRSDT